MRFTGVYCARDHRLDRDVALKVLLRFVSFDPERLHRFEQEAKATAALNHPNILAVFHVGSYEGAPYLVSELLEGETLREQLKYGPMPPKKAIDYGVQIAQGLAAAHEKGIVHRDLKPQNLFVPRDGRIKILDFGLAKLTHQESETQLTKQTLDTTPGAVLGTVGYMSPEQVRGQEADHRSDIFAFGAILYEMLSGKRAFHKPTSVETMNAILNEDPPALSQVVPNPPWASRCGTSLPGKESRAALSMRHRPRFWPSGLGRNAGPRPRPADQKDRSASGARGRSASCALSIIHRPDLYGCYALWES